jgi:hypothetical protein
MRVVLLLAVPTWGTVLEKYVAFSCTVHQRRHLALANNACGGKIARQLRAYVEQRAREIGGLCERDTACARRQITIDSFDFALP